MMLMSRFRRPNSEGHHRSSLLALLAVWPLANYQNLSVLSPFVLFSVLCFSIVPSRARGSLKLQANGVLKRRWIWPVKRGALTDFLLSYVVLGSPLWPNTNMLPTSPKRKRGVWESAGQKSGKAGRARLRPIPVSLSQELFSLFRFQITHSH